AVVGAILIIRISLGLLHLPYTQRVNFASWCCEQPGNPNRARIEAYLTGTAGEHLVLVKPKTDENNLFQWIYNRAEIDYAPIVWARDMGPDENRKLLEHFAGRKVWLVDPNVEPATLIAVRP